MNKSSKKSNKLLSKLHRLHRKVHISNTKSVKLFQKYAKDNLYDVVIIGAGLSGLTAARRLIEGGKKVLVLEAQDRVGGRTWSQSIGNGSFIDIGGQYIGKGHDSMYKLVSESGLTTFSAGTEGNEMLRIDGKNSLFSGSMPLLEESSLLEKAFHEIDYQSSMISTEYPWRSDNAIELDQISIGSWIDQTTSNKKVRKLMKLLVEGEICKNVENVSLFQVLSGVKSSGSFVKGFISEDGALQDRILGGAQGVSLFLYQQIHKFVRLNCPVTLVTVKKNHIMIGNKGFRVKTKKVIVAVPLPVVKNITFTPELPMEKQILIHSMEMGTVIKCHAVYQNPFWSDSGLSGSSICIDEIIEQSVDNSVPGASYGILTSFICADRAKYLLSVSDIKRKEIILMSYANLFGEKALTPIMYHDYSFSTNPWIGGCYSGFFTNGIYSRYGKHLAEPSGNIHWAGTETSTLFKGYMEGAVLSGERVAKEILQC
jgi:monoamine oxidase